MLDIGGQRPFAEAQQAAQAIHHAIHVHQALIGPVAKLGEPGGEVDHVVELVAMENEIAEAGGAFVNRLAHHRDVAKAMPGEIAEILVVVSGNENDLRAFARLAHDFLDHVVVQLVPIPFLAQRPAVDHVAHEIEPFAFGFAQEIKQRRGLGAARAEVDIRDKNRPVVAYG